MLYRPVNDENDPGDEECSSQSADYEENSEESDYDSCNSGDSMLDDPNDAVIGTASAGDADDRTLSDIDYSEADYMK